MSEKADPFQLQRFLQAQNPVFEQVCAELRAGQKISHWMWFIFPQIRGLGRSPTAMQFAIASKEEARAYLAHAMLGPRLDRCTKLVIDVQRAAPGRSASQIFGYPDDLKFRSSMTLFARAGNHGGIFQEALDTYFGGQPDPLTLEPL